MNGSGFVAQASEPTADSLKNPSVSNNLSTWDCVYFGSYYQSDATGKKKDPIKWRVLSLDGKVATVLADSVLDVRQYVESDDSQKEATWETSSLRMWLNDGFLKTAFSEEEQNGILSTTVSTANNKSYGSVGGNDTEDKVYIPSYADMKNSAYGFSTTWTEQSKTRLASKTNYFSTRSDYIVNHKKNSQNTEGEGVPSVCSAFYVLRTPGANQKFVTFIDNREERGRGNLYGNGTNDYYGIRPMIRIDLTKVSVWKYAGTINSDGKVVEYQYASDGTAKVVTKKTSIADELKAPTIRKVTNAGNYKLKITLNKVSGATGYEYCYSTSSKMKKATIKTGKRTSYTTKKLKKNKKYYITVRAYKIVNNKKSYSAWSKVKSIQTSKKKTVVKTSLSSTKLSMTVGDCKTLKINNNSKKLSWSIKSGKKNIALSKKTKKSVCVKAKKKGTAKIQAKIGKKKYICTVTVKSV